MSYQRWLLLGAKILWLATWLAALPPATMSEIWTVIAIDAKHDGRDSSLPDAAQLSYRYDKQRDMLWFRLSLYSKAVPDRVAMNLAIATGSENAETMNWWGTNKDFKFDKLVTATGRQRKGAYQGTVGVANAAGVRARNSHNLLQHNLQIHVEGDSIVIGIKRTDITDKTKMTLIAAVGSDEQWNDDIPNSRSAALDLAAPRPARLREIDSGRNNFRFPSDYKTLADPQPPLITKGGSGGETLILLPGVYSGDEIFDGFMARNHAEYKFFVVTPPGLNGTPARPLPLETTSYGELTWTRRLERDVVELMQREKLSKPVIVTHGFPGSLAAHELAAHNPDLVGGVIDISAIPLQLFPSPKDPSAQTPAPPAERVEYVDEGWAQKWFKYVTAETWESNNYPAAMYTDQADRAEQIHRKVERVPLAVKIRYLLEFMASDQTDDLMGLSVPLLALRPGFNERVFADSANSWFKSSFQSSWDGFSKNPNIRLQTVVDAGVLLLDDQPKLADDAIRKFVEQMKER